MGKDAGKDLRCRRKGTSCEISAKGLEVVNSYLEPVLTKNLKIVRAQLMVLQCIALAGGHQPIQTTAVRCGFRWRVSTSANEVNADIIRYGDATVGGSGSLGSMSALLLEAPFRLCRVYAYAVRNSSQR